MAFSKLVDYVDISPNRNSPRNAPVCYIIPHCFVGQVKVKDACDWFKLLSAECSCNYYTSVEALIGGVVDENDRSWCTSSSWADNRGIAVELASNKVYPYTVKEEVWQKFVKLCIDICKRYGKKKLLWIPEKDKALAYKPKDDEMVILVHRWFANKECPGFDIMSRIPSLIAEVNKALGSKVEPVEEFTEEKHEPLWYRVRTAWKNASSQLGAYEVLENAKANCPYGYSVYDYMGKEVYSNKKKPSGTQVTDLRGLDKQAMADKLLNIVVPIAKEYNLIPSVLVGQILLETGYLTTKLSDSNNVIGMKCDLINSQWKGSTWDGKSKVLIHTPEEVNGQTIYVDADFRVYENIEQCVKDICAFFTTLPKYVNAGIMKARSYEEQIEIEHKCGYATDSRYVNSVTSIVQRHNLSRRDSEVLAERNILPNETVSSDGLYIVQIGYYSTSSRANTDAVQFKNNKIDCIVTKKGDGYIIQGGAYEKESNAKKRVNALKKNKYLKKMGVVPFYFRR